MAQIPTITELSLVGVADAGVPNRERVVLRPTDRISLAPFVLIAGVVQPNGAVVPIPNMFLWLGELTVSPPGWIYVYTGPGQFRETKIRDTGQPALVFHWGHPTVIFGSENVIPALVRLNGLGFGGRGATDAPPTAEEISSFFKAVLDAYNASPHDALNLRALGNYSSTGDDSMRKDSPSTSLLSRLSSTPVTPTKTPEK